MNYCFSNEISYTIFFRLKSYHFQNGSDLSHLNISNLSDNIVSFLRDDEIVCKLFLLLTIVHGHKTYKFTNSKRFCACMYVYYYSIYLPRMLQAYSWCTYKFIDNHTIFIIQNRQNIVSGTYRNVVCGRTNRICFIYYKFW